MLLVVSVWAHAPELQDSDEDVMRLYGYKITILRPADMAVGKDAELTIQIEDEEANPIGGMDVQGQIMEGDSQKDIYYSEAYEAHKGEYGFMWTPSFAGDYLVQFIFRADDDEIIKPTFRITAADPRATFAWGAGILTGITSALIGLIVALPRKKKKFNAMNLFSGLAVGLLLFGLGYSVSYFYEAGGEKGFVVCGPDGCDLALHSHSQLKMNICGEAYHLPLEAGDLNAQHTHKERDRLHYHALIKTDESGTDIKEPWKLSAGDLFEQLGLRYTKDCFIDFCNGDKCPGGTVGSLRMTVNGVENSEFNDYVWKDGDVILISFG